MIKQTKKIIKQGECTRVKIGVDKDTYLMDIPKSQLPMFKKFCFFWSKTYQYIIEYREFRASVLEYAVFKKFNKPFTYEEAYKHFKSQFPNWEKKKVIKKISGVCFFLKNDGVLEYIKDGVYRSV